MASTVFFYWAARGVLLALVGAEKGRSIATPSPAAAARISSKMDSEHEQRARAQEGRSLRRFATPTKLPVPATGSARSERYPSALPQLHSTTAASAVGAAIAAAGDAALVGAEEIMPAVEELERGLRAVQRAVAEAFGLSAGQQDARASELRAAAAAAADDDATNAAVPATTALPQPAHLKLYYTEEKPAAAGTDDELDEFELELLGFED